MHGIKRIPLEERLKNAKRQIWEIPNIFLILTEDYFKGLYCLSKDSYIMHLYKEKCFNHKAGIFRLFEQGDSQLAELLYNAYEMPGDFADYVYYQILIEPFVRIEKFERSCDR